jgi:deoxyribodipyrimidine photo-lyase
MDQLDPLLRRLGVDRGVPAVSWLFKGGATAAKARFARFLQTSLQHYDSHSNQPQTDDISHMSPYLHFGQISPLYLALQVSRVDHGAARDAYIEQLVVRRELAFNYVHFQPNYDQLTSLPGWALNTLDAHRHDPRDPLYPPDQLEQSRTHDPYWNAAMDEMRHTGFMHNYMRMYWAKKILQWSASPEDAFQTTLYLNNRYFLDGRDPNSYVGVAWNYGLHDRAWKERPVFGKIRYMAAAGLRRKCDIEGYVRKVAQRIR